MHLSHTVSTSEMTTVPAEESFMSVCTMRGLLEPILRNLLKSALKSPETSVSVCLHLTPVVSKVS